MKNLYYIIGLSLIIGSCRNEDLYPIPEPEWAPVAEVQWVDQDKTFFNYSDLENSEFQFTLIGEDFGYEEARVESIEVFVNYNGESGAESVGVFTELPALVSISASEAASRFGMGLEDIELGDTFKFSFVVTSEDGRVFSLYNNNICNLIRIAGVCTLDALVLNPSVALTTVSPDANTLSLSEIAASEDDSYVFTLNKRDLARMEAGSAEVHLAYNDGTTVQEWKTLKTVSEFPSDVTVSATEAAELFGLTAAELEAGDEFLVKIAFTGANGLFSNYGSKACGVDFPSNVVYPQHLNVTGEIPELSWDNPYGASTAPAPTSTTGTCSLSISVVE